MVSDRRRGSVDLKAARDSKRLRRLYIYVPCAAQGTSFKNVPVHVCLLQGEAHTKGVAVALEKQKIIGDDDLIPRNRLIDVFDLLPGVVLIVLCCFICGTL